MSATTSSLRVSSSLRLFELRTHLHSEAFMGNTQKLIEQAYSAFNNRDIDSAMALMSENVSWPKASEGGRVVGKGEIRSYWTRQWQEFDPHVEPLEFVDQVGSQTHVRVHQLVKSRGRSMLDLFHTLQDMQSWGVSLVAQTGLQFDLRSAQGKLIASLMAALAEFERDLLRERVRSGIAAARKRGVVFGRRPGQRIKADRFAPKVLELVSEGQSYREISHRLGLSKNTVLDIVKRDRAA
jgi:hypothetical protein